MMSASGVSSSDSAKFFEEQKSDGVLLKTQCFPESLWAEDQDKMSDDIVAKIVKVCERSFCWS